MTKYRKYVRSLVLVSNVLLTYNIVVATVSLDHIVVRSSR